jgi:hypothetical protein
MKQSFYDQYGRAIDKPINAIAYELSNGGDKVRGKRHLWSQLAFDVTQECNKYHDLRHYTAQHIVRELKYWLEVNETKEG